MKIMGTTKSWNNKTQKDCFNYSGTTNIDHIWPEALNGSSLSNNKQRLTVKANSEKGDEVSGTVGEFRFSVIKHMTKKDDTGRQLSYGTMYIKKASSTKDEWLEVIPVK